MSFPVFYVVEGDILPIPFSSYDGATGASEAISGLAVTDIEIYKDVSVTQRASDNGYTLTDTDGIDVDGAVGINGFSVDISDNSDAGFYEVGPWYAVKIISITADAQTVNFIAAMFRIVSATRGLAGTALPAAAADAAGGLIISDAGGLDADAQRADVAAILVDTGTTLDDLIDTEIASIITTLGTPAGASLAADIAAIEAQTDDIGAAGAGLTAVPWNAAWDAEVQSEVEDALVVHRLDELLNADSDIDGAAPPTVGSVFHELMTKTAGSFTYDQTTDSLEALRDRGDAAWITATGFSTHSAADVWAVATRVLTAGTNLNNLSAAEVLTQVNAAIDAAIAELGVAAPTATPTLRTGLMLLYMALRNKTTTTATEQTISNNAGTTVAKAALSDDTVTFERSELASG